MPLEAVNWRVSVEGPRPDLGGVSEHMAARDEGSDVAAQVTTEPRHRKAHFDAADGFVSTPVYQRHRLWADFAAEGPAIIEEAESTTVVPPGWSVARGAGGCLLVRSEAAAGGAS